MASNSYCSTICQPFNEVRVNKMRDLNNSEAQKVNGGAIEIPIGMLLRWMGKKIV